MTDRERIADLAKIIKLQKPVEALQFNGSNQKQIIDWSGIALESKTDSKGPYMFSLHESFPRIIAVADWLIKDKCGRIDIISVNPFESGYTRQTEPSPDRRGKIAETIQAETRGGYLENWSEYRQWLTPEQQHDYFLRLADIITRQPELGINPYEIPHAAYDKYFTPPEIPDSVAELTLISDEELSRIEVSEEDIMAELNNPENKWGNVEDKMILKVSAYLVASMKATRQAQLTHNLKEIQEKKK